MKNHGSWHGLTRPSGQGIAGRRVSSGCWPDDSRFSDRAWLFAEESAGPTTRKKFFELQLPIAALCRRVQLFAQEHGESAPTYDVVYDVVRQLPADLLTMAHHGEKAYCETFELIHRREANRPNADALLYTTPVVNTPREIERDIPKLRDLLRDFRQEPVRREETRRLKEIQKRDADHRDSFFSDYDWSSEKLPKLKPTFGQVCRKYSDKQRSIGDPTRLILVDEADRLKMASCSLWPRSWRLWCGV